MVKGRPTLRLAQRGGFGGVVPPGQVEGSDGEGAVQGGDVPLDQARLTTPTFVSHPGGASSVSSTASAMP
jgi:hypothetical protein